MRTYAAWVERASGRTRRELANKCVLLRPNAVVLICVFVAAVLFAACTRSSVKDVSPELQPPPNARKIKHAKIKGFERIDYVVREPFPPRAVMTQLINQIERAGWHPLAESPFNPGEKSAYVEGWRKRVVTTGADAPRRWAYIWWSQWENEEGAILDVVLSYTYPRDAPAKLTELSVGSRIATRERLRQASLKVGRTHRVASSAMPITSAVIEEPDLESTTRR